jgi:hypothetical protein
MTVEESKVSLSSKNTRFDEVDAKDYSPKKIKFNIKNQNTGQLITNVEKLTFKPVTDWGMVRALKINKFGIIVPLDSELHFNGNIILQSPTYEFRKGEINAKVPTLSY